MIQPNIARATVVLLNLRRLTITKTTENLNSFLLFHNMYTTNCANFSSATSDKHTLSKMSQDSRRKVRWKQQRGSVFTTCLASSSSSCSTGMFIVTWRHIFLHARHMIGMQRRTGTPHSLPRPRDVLRVEVDRSSSMPRAAAGRFSTKWHDFESTFASILDVNSKPADSFSSSVFFFFFFVFVECAIKKRVSKKKKSSRIPGGARATRATCELRACR